MKKFCVIVLKKYLAFDVLYFTVDFFLLIYASHFANKEIQFMLSIGGKIMRHASGARSVLPLNLQQAIHGHWKIFSILEPHPINKFILLMHCDLRNPTSAFRECFYQVNQRRFSLILRILGLDYHKFDMTGRIDSYFGLPVREVLKSALKNRLDAKVVLDRLASLSFAMKKTRLCQMFIELGADIEKGL